MAGQIDEHRLLQEILDCNVQEVESILNSHPELINKSICSETEARTPLIEACCTGMTL